MLRSAVATADRPDNAADADAPSTSTGRLHVDI